jgi:hypothetical protein
MLQRRISDADAARAFGEIVKRLLDAKFSNTAAMTSASR